MCVCVCVWERERESEREIEWGEWKSVRDRSRGRGCVREWRKRGR